MLDLGRRQETLINLAGEVVHDLRNILQCLLSHTEAALARKSTNDPVFDMLSDMESLILKGRELSERFLAYDKGVSSQSVLLHFNTIIQDLKNLLEPQIPKSIAFAIQLSDDLYSVVGDLVPCEQMVMNLCLNAISAMPDGGRLLLSSRNLELTAEEEISPKVIIPPGKYVVLSVQDTGVGISKERQARIFDRFYTTKGQGKGTGLGLTVVRSVIESLGGYIDCRSTVGEGSTFTLFIPAVRQQGKRNEPGESRQPNSKIDRREPSILVVDDEQVILKFMEILLESYGYKVVTAQNEEDAIEILTYCRPDLVILDFGLPGRGGLFLFKELQKILPGVKALFISGYLRDSVETVQHPLAKNNFLAKPFTQRELLEKVETLLE